ncbi:MAG: HD domain-containing protein [Victivallaceae bacterium]|nr:HD domain-containing protein [Victivallaceae bacterium]
MNNKKTMSNNNFTTRFSVLHEVVKDRLEHAPGCHDFSHTQRVMHNAEILLAANPNADGNAVRLAALLHDIARPEELQAKGKICHAKSGAEIARKLLCEYKFTDPVLIERVSNAILRHRFRRNNPPQTLEERIIYDADKLDSIGAVGIGRAFHFAGREGAKLHNSEEAAINSAAYSREDSAYREYLVKLRHISERMLTVAGRELAAERAAFMDQFFERLNHETFG